MSSTEISERVAAINASDAPDLGLTEEAVRQLMDEISDARLTDDASLDAYDLLHARATFGRAW